MGIIYRSTKETSPVLQIRDPSARGGFRLFAKKSTTTTKTTMVNATSVNMSIPTNSAAALKPKKKCALFKLIKKIFHRGSKVRSVKLANEPEKSAAIRQELDCYNIDLDIDAENKQRRVNTKLLCGELARYTIDCDYNHDGYALHRAVSNFCSELKFFNMPSAYKARDFAKFMSHELASYNIEHISDADRLEFRRASSLCHEELSSYNVAAITRSRLHALEIYQELGFYDITYSHDPEVHEELRCNTPNSVADSTFSLGDRKDSLGSITSVFDCEDQFQCDTPTTPIESAITKSDTIELLTPAEIANPAPALFTIIEEEDEDDENLPPIRLSGISFITDDTDERTDIACVPAATISTAEVNSTTAVNKSNFDDWEQYVEYIRGEPISDLNKAELFIRAHEDYHIPECFYEFLANDHWTHLFDIKQVHWECRSNYQELWYHVPLGEVCHWQVLDEPDPFAVVAPGIPELTLTTPEGEQKYLRDPHYYPGAISWADLNEEDEHEHDPAPIPEAQKSLQVQESLAAELSEAVAVAEALCFEEEDNYSEDGNEYCGEEEGHPQHEHEGYVEEYYGKRKSLCDMNREELRLAAEEDNEIREYYWPYAEPSWDTHLFDIRLAKLTCQDRRFRHLNNEPMGWVCSWTLLDNPDPFRSRKPDVPEIIVTTPEGETKYPADMTYYLCSSSWADLDDEEDF